MILFINLILIYIVFYKKDIRLLVILRYASEERSIVYNIDSLSIIKLTRNILNKTFFTTYSITLIIITYYIISSFIRD